MVLRLVARWVLAPVLEQDRAHVEITVACIDLEADASRAFSVDEQYPVSKYAMKKVDGRARGVDELDLASDQAAQLGLKIETPVLCRVGLEENCDVDVAVRPRCTPCDASEEPDGEDTRFPFESRSEHGHWVVHART